MFLISGQDDAALQFKVQIAGSPGDTKRVVENAATVFQCQGSADSTGQFPTLAWFKDDVEITALDGGPDGTEPYVKTMSGGQKMGLFVDKVKEELDSILKCVGTLNGEEASASLKLVVIPLLVITSSKDQFGYLGEDGMLECKSTGTPEKEWKFANNTDIKPSARYIFNSDTFTIKGLTFEDAGVYKCSVFDFPNNQKDSAEIKFAVVDRPKILNPPTIQPNNPKVGDDVKITCTAEGTPKPTYQFKRGENPVAGNELEIVDEVNGILTLKDISSNSEGEYTCIASNRGGSTEEKTTLDVQIPPLILDMDAVRDTVEEEAVDIKCTVEGDPAPSMLWRKIGDSAPIADVPSGDGPFVETEASTEPDDAQIKRVSKTLRFTKIRPLDAGKYICEATSSAGNANKTVDLRVDYAPHFDTDYKEKLFYGWRGHQANLTCMTSANPLANFKWYIPSGDSDDVGIAQQIQNKVPYTVATVQKFPEYFLSSSSLLININGEDSTVYRDYLCEADNGQTAVQRVTLKEATAPGKPVLSILDSLSTMVEMKVEKPANDGGQPVTSYKYSYYEASDNANKETGVLEGNDIREYPIVFKIKQLKPSTNYVIEISAENRVSEGVAETVQFQTAEVSKPSILTITSPKMGLEPSSYTLMWAKPEDGGSPITKFTIEYQQVRVANMDSTDQWSVADYVSTKTERRTVENNPDALQYKITGLKSSSFYDVSITAENGIGVSSPARRIIKTSAGGADPSTAAEEEDEKEKGMEKGGNEEKPQGSENEEQAKSSTNPGPPDFLYFYKTEVQLRSSKGPDDKSRSRLYGFGFSLSAVQYTCLGLFSYPSSS
ncbi:hypothetical protein RRG08_037850 [Elysia crispata]|uniref:Neural cell adhesion molecule 1 n=1 Tax=Elysia crispata TaxID=231223 RepID=A0AAE1DHG3_9GAST|nr:hypothetical protein RRG08_037850 [Elysia crispata]